MTQEQYQEILKQVEKLEYNARFECGSYIQELIWNVKAAVVAAKPQGV